MNEPNSTNSGNAKTWKTKREMAAHFHCSLRNIGKMMQRRTLPFVKIGRFVRFDAEECDKALERYRHGSLFD